MAEGLLRAFYGDCYEAYSAGTQPSKVNSYAIRVMVEIGIDISSHQSKNVDVFHGMKFDYVVTVCNQAKEKCPFFRGGDKGVCKFAATHPRPLFLEGSLKVAAAGSLVYY